MSPRLLLKSDRSEQFGPPLPAPWTIVAAALVAIAGVWSALAVSGPRSPELALAALVAAAVILSWESPHRLAWLAGALLPIQVVNGLPHPMFEVVHVVVLGLVVLRYRPRLAGRSATVVAWLAGLLAALVLVRLAFGLARDPVVPTLKFVALTLAGVVVAALLAQRTEAHRPLMFGFLAGTTASAAVSILQAAGIELVSTADKGPDRYPGMALQAPHLSWHIVIAAIIATGILVTSHPGAARRATWVQLGVCGVGFVVCGAQGGIAGLGIAGLVILFRVRRSVDRATAARVASIVAAVVVVAVLALVLSGLGASSIRGLAGDPDKGFANETARVRSIGYGVEQLVDRPTTGLGVDAYDLRFDVRPHVLPLDAGVNNGVAGFLLGCGLLGVLVWLLVKGPEGATPSSLAGVALLSAMLVHALLTPVGPFASVERLSMLLIAAVAARGGSDPFPTRPAARDRATAGR